MYFAPRQLFLSYLSRNEKKGKEKGRGRGKGEEFRLELFLLLVHIPQRSSPRTDRREDGLAGRLAQQMARGLEQRDDAQRVDLDVLEDVGALDVPRERVDLRYRRVGDDDVQVRDAVLRLQLLGHGERALPVGRVVPGYDDAAAGAVRERRESLRCCALRVAGCGDHGLLCRFSVVSVLGVVDRLGFLRGSGERGIAAPAPCLARVRRR